MKHPLQLLLHIYLCFFFQASATLSPLREEKFKDFQTDINDVTFSIDPHLPLYHALELVAGILLVNYIEMDYKQKTESHFAPFKNHPVFSFMVRNGQAENSKSINALI